MNYGKTRLNWPRIGPFVGFRTSTDYGHNWTPPPHTPEKPIFGESGMWGYPLKIGAPHFVDFGKIKPLLEWDNNMGCVTVTYNPVLKRYIMCE